MHTLINCPNYEQQDATTKLATVRRLNLCFACLNTTTHSLNKCREAETCGINGCTKRHHKSLHNNPKPGENTNTKASKQVDQQYVLLMQERLRMKWKEDTIIRAEDTIRRLEAKRQQQVAAEARRRYEEVRRVGKRREEEVRRKLERENAEREQRDASERQLIETVKQGERSTSEPDGGITKGGESVKQREDDSEVPPEWWQMFETMEVAPVQNNSQVVEVYQSSQINYIDEHSAAKQSGREVAVIAARERPAVQPTPKEAEKAAATVIAEGEKDETIGRVSKQQQNRQEVAGDIVTAYAIEGKGDLQGETGDQRSVQKQKLGNGSFLLGTGKFQPQQKRLQHQPSLGWKRPPQLHSTSEKGNVEDDHPGVTLRPSDGRLVPPAA